MDSTSNMNYFPHILMLQLLLHILKIDCSLLWKKAADYNDLRPVTSSVSQPARSPLHCSTKCRQMSACIAFVFVPAENNTCQLLDTAVNTPQSTFLSSMNAGYYIMDSICGVPVDENTFRALILSDGTLFKYRIVRESKTHSAAELYCNNVGGHLIRITTLAKFTMMRSVVTSCSDYSSYNYRLDGNNNANVNVWTTSIGDAVPAEMWASGNPGNPAAEHCLELCSWSSFYFDDISCTSGTYFICEQ